MQQRLSGSLTTPRDRALLDAATRPLPIPSPARPSLPRPDAVLTPHPRLDITTVHRATDLHQTVLGLLGSRCLPSSRATDGLLSDDKQALVDRRTRAQPSGAQGRP